MARHQSCSISPRQAEWLIDRAQETGEDDPDILFLYGKALFQVAQKNSQVLGGAPATDPTFGNLRMHIQDSW